MRHTLFATALLASFAAAQSPLATGLVPDNQGNIGGGLFFDLTVYTTVTLTDLTFSVGSTTPAGAAASVNIWLGPQTYVGNTTTPALWTQVGSTLPQTIAVAGYQDVAAPILAAPAAAIVLPPGTYAIALEAQGCNHGYTNGIGCVGSAPPGSCSNASFSTTELQLDAGQAQNTFSSTPIFSPRVFAGSIAYTLGGGPTVPAGRFPFGQGCVEGYRSFYELFLDSDDFDLGYSTLRLARTGDRYDVTLLPGAATFAPSNSTTLGHPADGELTVTLGGPPISFPGPGGSLQTGATVSMSADGYVTLIGGNPAMSSAVDNNPDVSAFLTGQPRLGYWHDLDPAGSGSTHYDFDPVAGTHLFTWQNVRSRGGSGAEVSNFQIAFLPNGDIELRWGFCNPTPGALHPVLVGFTPGVSALDPGSLDLSANAPFSTDDFDALPLTLSGSANPVLGTTIQLTTDNPTTNPGIGILIGAPTTLGGGIPLSIFGLAPPGCFAHVDINQGFGFTIGSIGPLSTSLPVTTPNFAAVIGFNTYWQSVWIDSLSPLGFVTSNGLLLRHGL